MVKVSSSPPERDWLYDRENVRLRNLAGLNVEYDQLTPAPEEMLSSISDSSCVPTKLTGPLKLTVADRFAKYLNTTIVGGFRLTHVSAVVSFPPVHSK